MAVPSIPGWDGIHPAMVQFTIVSLWLAPIFVLVSVFSRRVWRTWAGAALIVMTIGSVAAWLAVASGHAAGQLVDKTPALAQAIARHEALGIQTRNLFTGLTLGFALFALLPVMTRKPAPEAARIGVSALFLVVYLGATFWIANTASHGGRLVHELGVRAMVHGPRAAVVAESPTTPADEPAAPPGGTPPAP